MTRRKLSVILITLVITQLSCKFTPVYYSDDKKLAAKAIDRYHDAFNRESYDEIFEAAHPDAKAVKSKSKLREILSGLHESLGKVVTSTLTKADVSMLTARERKVEMLYRTQFEQGVRNETFICISDGSQAPIHSFGVATDEELQQASGQ